MDTPTPFISLKITFYCIYNGVMNNYVLPSKSQGLREMLMKHSNKYVMSSNSSYYDDVINIWETNRNTKTSFLL